MNTSPQIKRTACKDKKQMVWKRSLTTSFMPLTVGLEAAETAATEGGEGGVGEPRAAVAAVSGSAAAVAEAFREEGATVRAETSTLGASATEGVRSTPPVPTAAAPTGAAVVAVEAALATTAEEAAMPVEVDTAMFKDGGDEAVVEAAGAAPEVATAADVGVGGASGRVACLIAGSVTSSSGSGARGRAAETEGASTTDAGFVSVAEGATALAEGFDEATDFTLLAAAVARTGCLAMGIARGTFSCV